MQYCDRNLVSCIEPVEDLIEEVEAEIGHSILNVSSWNPSDVYFQGASKLLPNLKTDNQIGYNINHGLELRSEILKHWKIPDTHTVILTENGTQSIITCLFLLKYSGFTNIYSSSQMYFSIEEIAKILKISITKQISGTRSVEIVTQPEFYSGLCDFSSTFEHKKNHQ